MKNFAAKLLLMAVVISGLSTLALANGNAVLHSGSETINQYLIVALERITPWIRVLTAYI